MAIADQRKDEWFLTTRILQLLKMNKSQSNRPTMYQLIYLFI